MPVALDPGGPPTRFRWVVLGLVFLAITVNYIDRMVMGLLAPDLKVRFHISDTEYGYIAGTCFGLAYAVGQLVSGRWLDWVGTRVGYAIALLSWSVASMLHAFAGSAVGFGVARALLGITESPAYPAATKTLAEWFPRKERAFAMGVVNAGANIGAVVAPLLVTWLAMRFGWQAAFLVTGTAGLAWLALWLPIYRLPQDHPRVNRAELAVIEQDPPEAPGRVRWAALLAKRQSWAFMLGKFLTDPVWSFYLFWLPLFLKDQHRMEPAAIAWAMATVYIIADLGSIAGGWMSSAMIRQGFSVNAARKSTLAACAAVAVPAVLVPSFATPWPAVLICGFALAAHQGFSTNLYTLVSDMYPKRAVGSVAGMGGTCGYIGTAILLPAIGKILDATGKNYTVVFLICGLAYLLSFALIHLLAPGLAQARFDDGDDQPGGPGAGGFEVVPRPAPPPGAEH
ncbi:MAG TPA: MFS transporter [Humisphaera sp.]